MTAPASPYIVDISDEFFGTTAFEVRRLSDNPHGYESLSICTTRADAETDVARFQVFGEPELASPSERLSSRATIIARIHALALWLAEHPEAPAPTYVTATYGVTPKDEVDEATRVAGIVSIAEAVGIELHEGEPTVQGELVLHYDREMTLIYRVAAHKDHGSKARYL